jgi:hypothetical protein
LIRYANRYDNNKIIDLIKDFAIKSDNPLTKNPLSWSKNYVESILNSLYAGQGFVLVDNECTGVLVAVKTQSFWNENVYQLQETMLHGKTNIVIARLIKEYLKIAKDMINKNQINQAVMSSYPNIDLSKFGLKLLEHHWEIS